MDWNLNDKKILITGGTRGIGHATVRACLDLGAEVLLTSRTAEDVDRVLRELDNDRVHGFAGDVTDAAHREALRRWIAERWGRLDVLVNSAGINTRKATVDYAEEDLRAILDLNLIAPFELSRLLFPLLGASGRASVINIASIAATVDVRTGPPYTMSKAGLIQQSRSLAVEWGRHNIRVNTVSPWYTRTPRTQARLDDPAQAGPIFARTPLGRAAEAEEVAAVIAFLAMDLSGYITGQDIKIDGGLSANGM